MCSPLANGLLYCILYALATPLTAQTEPPMNTKQESTQIFTFDSDATEPDWYSIDDRVMGGVSRSSLVRGSERTGIFRGHLSLERNGGFASVRSLDSRFDLSGYEAIELRVRGDGNRYKLCLRTDGRFDGVLYQAGFDTPDGEWAIVRIPLSSFIPTWRGRYVPQAGELDTSRIRSFGLMISDKQEGEFALELDWIGAD